VISHNKACMIALPLENESGQVTSRESYLKPEEVKARLNAWEDEGYDTRGFVLGSPTTGSAPIVSEGQSRAIHPDPEDEKREHYNRSYRVSIPDRREWEAYVNYLKEEKLRALGVTSGDEEPPSRKSPVPSLMSRQASSQSSALLTSPPLPPSAVHARPFAPSFQPGAQPGKPVVSHFPRYSMAMPFADPNPFMQSQSPVHRLGSPQGYLTPQPGSRITSPFSNSQMHGLGNVVPPPPPPTQHGLGQNSGQDPGELLGRMLQQQSLLHAQQLQQQHQQQQMLQPAPHPSLTTTQARDNTVQPVQHLGGPKIITPYPRGHRQNESETLQREVDEAEAYYDESSTQEEPKDLTLDEEKKDNEELPKEEESAPANERATTPGTQRGPNVSSSEQNSAIGRPRRHHGSKTSVSKLNVNAPEFKFEKRSTAAPEVFAFLGNKQPRGPAAPSAQWVPIGTDGEKASFDRAQTTKFNATAPEFTPGAAPKPAIQSRVFSFSSLGPSFSPNAPTFYTSQPKGPVSKDAPNKDDSIASVKKIFGDFQFSGAIQPPKKSKALPIVQPGESADETVRDADGQEDESGRITQADGRQKRARREQDDGDQVPLFENPSHTPWMDNKADERAAYFSNTHSPSCTNAEPTTLEAATDLLEEVIDELASSEASNLMREDEPAQTKGRSWDSFAFHDIDHATRPQATSREGNASFIEPTDHGVVEATQEFLSKSKQYKSEFDKALSNRSSRSPSTSDSEEPRVRRQHREDRIDRIDRIDHAPQAPPLRQDILDSVRYVEPSIHEIDAVMKHLNQSGDSDIGVERSPSPAYQRPSPARSSVRSPHPAFNDSWVPHELLAPAPIRSDAPSPSPNRLREPFQYLPPTDTSSVDSAAVSLVARNARYSPSYRPSKNSPSINRLNSPGSTPPSDWNDAISSVDEDKFKTRTGFFDSRVNDLVGEVVQQRLGPLEKILSGIQQSLAMLSKSNTSRTASRRPRSSGPLEIENSDADDEEDEKDGVEPSQSTRKSPLRDRRYDQLKASIKEIGEAQQASAPPSQLADVVSAINDLKSIMQQAPQAQTSVGNIKTIIEEALGKQMRGRSGPVTSSSQAAAAEKSSLHIAGLESMLKVAEGRADDEMKARRATEDALADNQRLLRTALQDAAQQRESAEATERSLLEYHEERQHSLKRTALLEGSQEHMEKTIADLSDKSAALEGTLAEYRLSSDQWRTEIDDARHENKDLRRNITTLKDEVDTLLQDRQALKAKFETVQDTMALSSREIAADQSRWRRKEEEHSKKLEGLSARLEAEARTRERLELEIERLEAQEKESMKSRIQVEQMQKANAHLDTLIGQLKSESHEHQTAAERFQRDARAAKETSIMEVHRTRSALEADIKAAKSETSVVYGELTGEIRRLQKELEDATSNAEKSRSRHELMLEEASDSRHDALREAADARDAALQEHYRFHQRTLEEMKGQHQRALDNTLEDKQRSETYLSDRLNLADEKLAHYQEKVVHLEGKLEIAKSAAQAAVQAAQAKKSARSPSSARAPVMTKVSLIPEKVSPQALRESILVLQEQLQARESRIEDLESQLSAVDTEAPAKLRDAEVEITWLRELLGVRIDDLQDIITTLSSPSYNREAVKDAAIRLKANLQMEQQEKERALAGAQTFPSLSSISNLAASPKALPMAAAAAWGNWRKGRESGFGNLSAIANSSLNQTPSKPSSSPQSFFAGLMTPPRTELRTTPPDLESRPTSSRSKRAIRGPRTPRHSMSLHDDTGALRGRPVPVTPPLMRKGSYDLDASENPGFGDEEGTATEYNTAAYEIGEEEEDEPFGPRIGTFAGSR